MSATKAGKEYEAHRDSIPEGVDPLDAMLGDLGVQAIAGWHASRGKVGYAMHPEAAADVDAWAERCLAMHQDQETILPDAKPPENTFARPDRTSRGD